MMNHLGTFIFVSFLAATVHCKPIVLETSVVLGNSVQMNCSCRECVGHRPVWLFESQVIFAESIQPESIGVRDVNGDFMNATYSVLEIERLTAENEGNYTCEIGNYTIVYMVQLTRPMVHMMCMKSKCPDTLQFDPSQVYEFNCYSDQLHPETKFSWHMNNDSILKRGITETFHKTDGRVAIGSTLKTSMGLDFKNISCSLGSASDVILVQVREKRGVGGIVAASLITVVTFLGSVVGAYALWMKKNKVPAAPSRHRISRSYVGSTIQEDQSQGNNDTSPDTGSLLEYDDIANIIDLKSYDRKSICFRGNISISPTIMQWSGKLNIDDDTKQDVVISFIQDDCPDEVKELWERCTYVKLSMPEHTNILKALGHSTSDGIFYLIQDNYGMTSLDFSLMSEYSNFSILESDLSIDTCLGYAYDVIKGMVYLNSQECYHPGLCAKRIMVNNLGICKLHCFCPKPDIDSYLSWIVLKDEANTLSLPPECLSDGDYTTASDLWGIGLTLWEIFLGDLEALRQIVAFDATVIPKHVEELNKPPYCPEELWNTMKSCFSIRKEDRPTIDALNSRILQKPELSNPDCVVTELKILSNGFENQPDINVNRGYASMHKVNEKQNEDIKQGDNENVDEYGDEYEE